MTHKPLKSPKVPKDIAKQLRWLAEHMIDIGTSMDYLGGFNVRMAARGNDMIDAGMLAKEWADNIEAELQ